MIRAVNEDEFRRIGLMLWGIKNSCSWALNEGKDVVPRALCAVIVAQISYCFITDDEREHRNRAKVVPSDWHYTLIQQKKLDIVEILRRSDVPNIEFFHNRNFVVIGFCLGDVVFIGIRGTQFAYDWIKNIRFVRKSDSYFSTSSKFHSGFYNEAVELDYKIKEYFRSTLQKNSTTNVTKLCICGHSLGGAIAALILQSQRVHGETFCYTFGAPRITNLAGQNAISQPVAFREALDIVPHCPPKLAGYYTDYLDQRNADGSVFSSKNGQELTAFPTWVRKLLVYEGVKNHSVEIYREKIRSEIKRTHKNIDQYLVDLESRIL
ncbi:hypothetical protein GCM10007160_24280 [Litchfieldella qijiaojingensis]|uniref:Fungal lipase-type domain-containing protein n=1 Tax=Litchfieldella qijiaojingensis TaxID=980347 RepID=A0ABQ2YUM0_9GAMM|nr:lipase family protein [Halomonas qijiaojingensis]GGX95801.1 hypothetical protein GCM10007160_24280 [Halomonas qijiaojingensis]